MYGSTTETDKLVNKLGLNLHPLQNCSQGLRTFMSAKLLRDVDEHHTITNELRSREYPPDDFALKDPAPLPACLQSYGYFIQTTKESLNGEWSCNSAAASNLIDFSSGKLTRREQEVKRYMNRKQWETSKGTGSTSSKRPNSSPTPLSKCSRTGTTPLGSSTNI